MEDINNALYISDKILNIIIIHHAFDQDVLFQQVVH